MPMIAPNAIFLDRGGGVKRCFGVFFVVRARPEKPDCGGPPQSSLTGDSGHFRTAALQLQFKLLEAAVKMVDALQHRLTFGR
jgi:hypothetical protein